MFHRGRAGFDWWTAEAYRVRSARSDWSPIGTLPVEEEVFEQGSSAAELARGVKERLEAEIPRPMYDTWVMRLQGVSLSEDCLVMAAPTRFSAEWLERRLWHRFSFFGEGVGLFQPVGRPVEGASYAGRLANGDVEVALPQGTPRSRCVSSASPPKGIRFGFMSRDCASFLSLHRS